MASVSNLNIAKQANSDQYYASWTFGQTSGGSGSGSGSDNKVPKKGDWVTIKQNSGATWYNGASIPDWVYSKQWLVIQVTGDRAVLGKDSTGSYNIQSAINVKYLSGGTGTGSGVSGDGVSADQVDHYEVKWYYDTGDGTWFSGTSSNTEDTNSTYSPPSNALKIRVTVKPVSKTYTSNGKEVSYWTGTLSTKDYTITSAVPPDDVPTPTVEIDEFTLTATVNDISDAKTDKIQFEVYNGDTRIKVADVQVVTCRAVYTCSISPGGQYRVRCRAIYMNGSTKVYGEWSNFSGETTTIPVGVTNVRAYAETSTSIRVTWNAVTGATSYKVEYAINRSYFDSSSQISSVTVTNTTAYITGLDADEWFIRVQAINDIGESSWSNIVSCIIGTPPEPPTTWSLTSTVVVGEQITLYWVHNSEDGSKMSEAEVLITINGTESSVLVPGKTTDEETDEDPIYSYSFDSSTIVDGAVILWKVRTKGVVPEWGDWSVQRTINLYAPPTISFELSTVEDILETLPITITAIAGPENQTPISYHVSVVANSSYETNDFIGNPVFVTAGTEIYSKVFDHSDWNFSTAISAGDITLESGQTYAVRITLAMNSGLTATDTKQFTVSWEDPVLYPDAGISIDPDSLSAYISPFCINNSNGYAEGVTLSVYRRESNGTFTEIAMGLPNDRALTVTDPHPSLDYARYRIVVQDISTGSVTYEDLPGYPVDEHGIIIQWDEAWSNFDYTEEASAEVPPYVGSMIRLPYNIDIAEAYDKDVSLVEYIGRKHPVSYYGTQLGESATWNTDIDKNDKELIYALRRLSSWTGDVYVREPSGIGYWAQIAISMPIKHKNLVIPVSLTIKRVEGSSI